MNAKQIEAKFATMGARFQLNSHLDHAVVPQDYLLDIQRDRQGEYFEMRVANAVAKNIEISIPHSAKHDRHLLMFVRTPAGNLDRFLCGHDERAWFVAAVPGGASSVEQAKEALKPQFVRQRQRHLEVPFRFRNRRKNEAFMRQGEWFFIPATAWSRDPINERAVLRNEPLRRGAGKPHLVEELFRVAGEVVYISARVSGVFTEAQHRRYIRDNPNAARWEWQAQRRDPRVYARGTVRHADHATIRLPDWHRVIMNTETETETMRNVTFVD